MSDPLDIGFTLGAEFDFSTPATPRMFYVVASSPRSGSTFLCRLLWSTGLMGAPDEYFSYQSALLKMAARLQVTTLRDYMARLLALRTSPNGVFGFHAQWDAFFFMMNAGFVTRFPGLRYVYIERRDRVAQAVSHARAVQTAQWTSLHAAIDRPVYDRERIEKSLRRIEHEVRQWNRAFLRLKVEPMRVTYESLSADPNAVVEAVMRRFGIDPDPAQALRLPPTQKQSDALNAEWIERFRRETPGLPSDG